MSETLEKEIILVKEGDENIQAEIVKRSTD
jgi:hypothetical protein